MFAVVADVYRVGRRRVALCCLDYDGKQLVGRVDAGHSIRDVWNGPLYREIRGLHRQARQSQIPLCANCTKAFL